MKELELAAILFHHPEIAASQGEILAALPFQDALLDRFRHELLNLAASGFRLENQGLEAHLDRHGMSELAARLKARAAGEPVPAELGEDVEARWLGAARHLRDIAEREPERLKAMERFKTEATEESWAEALSIRSNEG